MRKSFQAFLALSLLASGVSAQAEETSWYLDLSFGAVAADAIDPPGGSELGFDGGVSTALSLGRRLGDTGPITWSIEGELFYTSFKADEGDLADLDGGGEEEGASATAFLLNLEADIDLTRDVALYLGAGVGVAPNISYDSLDSGNYNQIDTDGVATQFQIGLRYLLGTNYSVSLGYRLFATESVAVEKEPFGTDDVDFTNHIFELGFRWGL